MNRALFRSDDARPPGMETGAEAWLRIFGEDLLKTEFGRYHQVDHGDSYYYLLPLGVYGYECGQEVIYSYLQWESMEIARRKREKEYRCSLF